MAAPSLGSPIASIVVTLSAFDIFHEGLARPDRFAVNMNCAGATRCHATAEFGSGHFEFIPDHPQKRGAGFGVDLWSAPFNFSEILMKVLQRFQGIVGVNRTVYTRAHLTNVNPKVYSNGKKGWVPGHTMGETSEISGEKHEQIFKAAVDGVSGKGISERRAWTGFRPESRRVQANRLQTF